MGVDYRFGSRVEGIRCLNDRVVEVTIRDQNGDAYSFADDYFVAALPVERMIPLLTPEMLRTMRRDPIVFALANPVPEIDYRLAQRAPAARATPGRRRRQGRK